MGEEATPTIRQAEPADVAELRRIIVAAFEKYVPRIGRKPAPMLADYEAHVAAGEAFVLSDQDETKGALVVMVLPDCLLIEVVAVDPLCQGKGYGRILMAQAEAAAQKAGSSLVRLYTNAKMTENIALYEHLGYAESRRTREGGFDRVYMEKTVAP